MFRETGYGEAAQRCALGVTLERQPLDATESKRRHLPLFGRVPPRQPRALIKESRLPLAGTFLESCGQAVNLFGEEER
jgi:hypothetical protein